MAPHSRSLLPVCLILMTACAAFDAAELPRATSWWATPTSLAMNSGSADTVTITVRDQDGDPFDGTVTGGWELVVHHRCSQPVYGGAVWCPFRVTPLDAQFPRRYQVVADSVAVDTLVFSLGHTSGCADPPECQMSSWRDQVPPIRVILYGR